MYDLSWLNPTPHAIAVYASQPLSPVATQHSLPSGCYSLLGPDLHRLDRTSFAWRTHSITSLGAPPGDHPFNSRLSWLRNRQSVPCAIIFWGLDFTMPASCRRRA